MSPTSSPSTAVEARKGPPQTLFGDAEYASGNGMITTVWGPAMWHFLHAMAFNYPIRPSAEDKKRYRDFILSLRSVLPCGKCRENLRSNLRALPLRAEHMRTRETFSRYVFDLHEHVNRMLGKPSGLSFEEVRDTYEHFRARCPRTSLSAAATAGSESGCTEPRYVGKKPQCVIEIVPRSDALARSRKHIRVRKDCLKRKIDVSN